MGGGKKGGSKKGPTKGQKKLASLGRAPKSFGGKTKAQKMAVANKAKYGGTAKAAAANKAANKVAAGNRYQQSQAQKAATKAYKSMTDAKTIKSLQAAAGTNKTYGGQDAQANLGTGKDGGFGTGTYGGGMPSNPSYGISTLSAPGTYGTGMPSNPAYKGVGARDTGPVRYKNSDYLTATPYVNAFKRTFGQDATLQGNRFNPADRAAALGAGYLDAGAGLVNAFKNMGPQGVLGFGKKIPNVPTLPKFQNENLEKLRGFGSVAIPALQTFGAAQRLAKVGLGQEISQMKLPNTGKYAFSDAPGAFRPKLTKTGIEGVSPVTIASAFTPGMLRTGPTAGGSAAILGTATGLSAAQQAKAAQTGGLNIGGSSAEASEGESTSGSKTGRTLGNRFLGGIDAVMRDTTDFDRRGVGNPASFGLENTVAGSVLNAAAQETGTINQFRKDTDNFSNLTNFNKLSNDEKVKTAQNVLKFTNDSQAAQALGEGLGLGKDFKTKINDAVDNVQGRLEGVTADRNSLYGVTSDFARDIGTDPDLNPINKFLTAVATNNLGKAGKEPRKLIESLPNKFLGINNTLPINNEMARDIKAAFQANSPTTEGLSAEQRGIIGSAGNRLLSGKATDGLREATYGYGGREGATNAGLTEGQPLNFSDIQNTAFAMRNNLGTGTTLASQRFDEGKRLVGAGGKVTAGSLIRGSLPGFGNRTGSSGSTTPTRGTGTTGTATPEELLIPQTPTYTAPTQTGTDTSNLQQIQQQSYMQNLAQLGITNLMQLPQFRTQQQPAPRRFRSFRRDYF